VVPKWNGGKAFEGSNCGGTPGSLLADSLGMKLSQSDRQKQPVKERQHYQHRQQRKVRKLGYERSTQSLAGVHEGIHQDDFLQDGKVSQSAPRIIGAAEEDHGSQNHAEHQADVGLIDAAAKRQTAAGREKRHQQRNAGEG
jgi:hypothetical protein